MGWQNPFFSAKMKRGSHLYVVTQVSILVTTKSEFTPFKKIEGLWSTETI